MRIYLPSTAALLSAFQAEGSCRYEPFTAFGVTPALRERYSDSDEESLEYAAFLDAARGSLRLLENDPFALRRRIVISAEVEDAEVTFHPDLEPAVLRLSSPLIWGQVQSVHVDGLDAEMAVRQAALVSTAADLEDDDAQFTVDGLEDYDLEWYAPQEYELIQESLAKKA